MKKTVGKIAVLFMAALMIFSCAFSVSAANTGKITVKVGEENAQKLESIGVIIYKIANAGETGYELTSDFAAGALDCNDISESNLRAFANYAKTNTVPSEKKTTNSDDEIALENLEDGIYLFVVDESGDFGYESTAPFAVAVEDGEAQTYNLTLKANGSSNEETDEDESTEITSDSESKKDSETSKESETVKESVTSKEIETTKESETVKESESTAKATETEIPSESGAVEEESAKVSDTSLAKALAQTGMLQWPIPVFGGLGLVLIVIGIIAFVSNKKKAKSK